MKRLIFILALIGNILGEKCTWDNCPDFSNDPGVVNLHLVAHTHDDMGWLKTADDYFTGFHNEQVNVGVQFIIDSVVNALKRNPDRKFSYAEVGFMTRWLEDRSAEEIQDLINLVNNGQLELVGGGWVQPDEAASHYIDIIDQYTLGLRRLNYTFGSSCSKVKTGWQLDPFGHSREHSNLLSMMGHESVFFARENHLEHDIRKREKRLEFKWFTSDENPSRNILGGAFFAHYGAPSGMCYDLRCHDKPIIIDPQFDNYDPQTLINNLKDYVENQRLPTQPHKHVLFMMGDDFQYENAEQNFRNMDNGIKLVRNMTNYRIFYSTPACYTKAVLAAGVNWTNKTADFFPYGSDSNAYWTGYFTSKPAFKGLIRQSSNILNTFRQINTFASNNDLGEWTSPEEILERACALSQHHDAVTGTSKEHVTQNYEYRLLLGWSAVESLSQITMEQISRRLKGNAVSFPVQTFCRQLNESACDFTTNSNSGFTVILYNGNSQSAHQLIRIPVSQQTVSLQDASGNQVSSAWTMATFKNGNQINNPKISTYQLQFVADIPANGFTTYFVKAGAKDSEAVPFVETTEVKSHPKSVFSDRATSLSNDLITVNFDSNNLVSSITDKKSGKTYPLKQHFMYYEGHDNNGRASGAYIFRPQDNTATEVNSNPTLSTNNLEARQIFGDWVSQTIRLTPNRSYVEFEWTVGPLPKASRNGKNYGKEFITRYEASGIKSGTTFYTDANGRQMIKRTRNSAPDYTYENTEPIAANMYPVNSRAIIKDSASALAVLVDRSCAGGSIVDSSLEFLIHRRDYYDDGFGVDEPLNEPGNDGRGLVVRGRHRIFITDPTSINKLHREGAYELFHDALVSFSPSATFSDYSSKFAVSYSGVASALPSNVHLLTLKQLSPGTILLRLEHIYAKGEDSTLSNPVTINLSTLFKDLKVNSVQEMLLGGNSFISGSGSTSITLNPQDIKTFQLTVSL
jgi:lysosomal alpha-mannosidase